jgi:hypothetical protein
MKHGGSQAYLFTFPDMDNLGFDARVWRLEQLLVNLPSKDSGSNAITYENEVLSDRIAKLQNELESVLMDDKALRDFVEKCKYKLWEARIYEYWNSIDRQNWTDLDSKHEKILNPMATPFAVEQELLDSTTKKELVLAASEELETFASQLKQIKALEHVLESSDIAGWCWRNNEPLPYIILKLF